MSNQARHEKLDVEEDEDRRKRLQSLMERISTTDGGSSSNTVLPQGPSLPKVDLRDRTAPTPNTELLDRIQAFLPQLEASNKALLEKAQSNPTSVDIEHVEPGQERYIEMNLGLGVYETRAKPAKKSPSEGEDEDEMEDDSSDSPDSDSDSESGDGDSEDSNDPVSSFFSSLHPTTTNNNNWESDDDDDDDSEADSDDYDDNDDSDSDSDVGPTIPIADRLIRPLPKRAVKAKPTIEVLDDSPSTNPS